MTHHGQELGFGARARFRLLPGLAQLGVTRLDLAQHGVEPLDEVADLVGRAALGPERVVRPAAHLVGQPRQLEQGPGEHARQHQRQHDARQDRHADEPGHLDELPVRFQAYRADRRVGRAAGLVGQRREAPAHVRVARVGGSHEATRQVGGRGRPVDRGGDVVHVGLELGDQHGVRERFVGAERIGGRQTLQLLGQLPDGVEQRLAPVVDLLFGQALVRVRQEIVDGRVGPGQLVEQRCELVALVQVLLGELLEQAALRAQDVQPGQGEQHREGDADRRKDEELGPNGDPHRAAAVPRARRAQSSPRTSPT